MAEGQEAAKVAKACNCLIKPRLKTSVDELWKIFGDFGAIGKILSGLANPGSKIIEGENSVPNCVRYVSGENPDGSISFAKERLLTIDNTKHSLSYKVEENSFGMIDYVGYLNLEDGGDGTTVLEWGSSFDIAEGGDAKLVETMLTGMFVACVTKAETLAGGAPVVPDPIAAA